MNAAEQHRSNMQVQLGLVRDALSRMPRDANRTAVRPLLKSGTWRGKPAWLAGYTWARIGSNPMTGRVYEATLGHGETPEAAVEMLLSKVPDA